MNNEDEESEDLSRPYSMEASGNLINIYTLQQQQQQQAHNNSEQENGPSLRYVVATAVGGDYKPCYRSLVSKRRRSTIHRTD